MIRRNTEYYQKRSSVAIVSETRGVPYQIMCYIVGFASWIYAIRTAFWCKYILFYEGELMATLHEGMFGDCENDPYKKLISILFAGGTMIIGIIRVWVASAVHVVDLYSAMMLLVVSDVITLYGMIVSVGFGAIPLVYQLLTIAAVGYEGYVLLVSRRAHMKRLKMKEKK